MEPTSDMVRAARAAWPGVVVEESAFLAYLAGREIGQCTADLYLACACGMGDPRALLLFDERVLSVVDPALSKLGTSRDVIAEVKQRLRASLLVGPAPRIAQFSGRGDLRGWVRVIAVREAIALGKQAQRHVGDEGLVDALLSDADPEVAHLKRYYRAEFKASFAAALAALEERERLLLRQQLIDGVTIDEAAALFRVHRATAARWMERARQRVLELTLASLRQKLAVGPAELDSILRLIRSQLEVSMGPLGPRSGVA